MMAQYPVGTLRSQTHICICAISDPYINNNNLCYIYVLYSHVLIRLDCTYTQDCSEAPFSTKDLIIDGYSSYQFAIST